MDNLDINGIDELTLDENAKVILKKGSDLNIKNIKKCPSLILGQTLDEITFLLAVHIVLLNRYQVLIRY